ncbi:MAG: NUDIX hydrolase [Puniceicoccaceae bacterium]|nr:NUDIX hydrolase [Puniceicoccaceae bacterium]|tara:strand:+ start:651 stop:1112 length:462 start_codon:yes stop_codon:yes gene_type:complete
MQIIRSAARALIIRNRSILFVEMKNAQGVFFLLPGGGQLHGETLSETVKRECAEELGVQVSVGSLYFTREYIGENHSFDPRHIHFHQIEHVFFCDLVCDQSLGEGHSLDKKQVGYKWIAIDALKDHRILPSRLKELLQPEPLTLENPYLGDVN